MNKLKKAMLKNKIKSLEALYSSHMLGGRPVEAMEVLADIREVEGKLYPHRASIMVQTYDSTKYPDIAEELREIELRHA